MATKSLTHIFMIMRDKAIQRRNMYKRVEMYSDQDSLVRCEELENGVGGGGGGGRLPEWAGMVEEVQYNTNTLKEKIKRLAALQSNLVRRPSLDDNTEEERQLTTHNNEIRRTLERCQMLMLQIKHTASHGREGTLNRNVVRSLGFALQEVKNEFMTTCSAFTASMNNFKKSSSFVHEGGGDYDSDYGTFEGGGTAPAGQNQAWTQEQMLFLADNTQLVQEKDRAVQHILQSTLQLNQLFKDVAQLVSEQGTILDRIDFNVEHAAIKVEEGGRQLKKADRYHRKNRNMKCILGLSGSIILLIFILVIAKANISPKDTKQGQIPIIFPTDSEDIDNDLQEYDEDDETRMMKTRMMRTRMMRTRMMRTRMMKTRMMKMNDAKVMSSRKRVYREAFLAFGFTFIVDKGVQKPHCVVCHAILCSESMKSNQLRTHLIRKHPDLQSKPVNYFRRLEEILNDRQRVGVASRENAEENDQRDATQAKPSQAKPSQEELIKPAAHYGLADYDKQTAYLQSLITQPVNAPKASGQPPARSQSRSGRDGAGGQQHQDPGGAAALLQQTDQDGGREECHEADPRGVRRLRCHAVLLHPPGITRIAGVVACEGCRQFYQRFKKQPRQEHCDKGGRCFQQEGMPKKCKACGMAVILTTCPVTPPFYTTMMTYLPAELKKRMPSAPLSPGAVGVERRGGLGLEVYKGDTWEDVTDREEVQALSLKAGDETDPDDPNVDDLDMEFEEMVVEPEPPEVQPPPPPPPNRVGRPKKNRPAAIKDTVDPDQRVMASLLEGLKVNNEFMENFNPKTSERMRRKKKKVQYFNSSGRGRGSNPAAVHGSDGSLVSSGRDLCDCLLGECPGCHFPCVKCGSGKCGKECRINRKWYYDKVEVEGSTLSWNNEYVK
ncbi:Syntaxin-16 [Chionoecetes opilio]|uniref:Syntaxin-16 n=1 Tax=Chionoecetes opilio TaxID=41210 RepID=A0A8J4XP36_CHIOP|nr:Syntaxin-16 [Chionoecetes opilio]